MSCIAVHKIRCHFYLYRSTIHTVAIFSLICYMYLLTTYSSLFYVGHTYESNTSIFVILSSSYVPEVQRSWNQRAVILHFYRYFIQDGVVCALLQILQSYDYLSSLLFLPELYYYYYYYYTVLLLHFKEINVTLHMITWLDSVLIDIFTELIDKHAGEKRVWECKKTNNTKNMEFL